MGVLKSDHSKEWYKNLENQGERKEKISPKNDLKQQETNCTWGQPLRQQLGIIKGSNFKGVYNGIFIVNIYICISAPHSFTVLHFAEDC